MISTLNWDVYYRLRTLDISDSTTPEQFENPTSIVLFAINWGGTHAPEHCADWQNFHTKGQRGDCTLRNSIGGIVDKAPYMTDVFKLVPTPRASATTTSNAARESTCNCARREMVADHQSSSPWAKLLSSG
ncbi:MAG: hypothetical protein SPK00_06515 [Corynebacterium glucuronolyticum]|nr:hypothetical protein [Corynebacterium glucuronolyticum]MDD7586193.1 hypothetical protein [Mycobacteriaceae bacterium]MDY5834385.1 hypothetical protein [Corynebacterium glucuronolyticum]